jgi:hypothetical protein
MSAGVFLGLILMSALVGLGQWLFFRLFNHTRPDYIPLAGSLFLANLALVLLRGIFR